MIALDKSTGKELWRVDHPEMDTWATPLVVEHDGRPQVIVNAMNRVRSYDLQTGKVVWEGPGTTMNVIPSPVSGNGMVFIMSGFRGNNLKAIKLADANGDISTTGAIAWQLDRDTPVRAVAAALRQHPVFPEDQQRTACRRSTPPSASRTTRSSASRKPPEKSSASPVGADGRVYITGRDGVTTVVETRPGLRGARGKHAGRRLRCVDGARRQ